MNVTIAEPHPRQKGLNMALWTAQVLVAAVFVMAGVTKLTTPLAALAANMPWTGDVAPQFVRVIGFIDLAGGIGILLPGLLRILPGWGVAAALGCAVLQVCAMVFHLSRGEWAVVAFNAVLLSLSLFVLWGRWKRQPIRARGAVQ